MIPRWAYALMLGNALALSWKLGREPWSWSAQSFFFLAAILGLSFSPAWLMRNRDGIGAHFSYRALRTVEATPAIVVRLMGWLLLLGLSAASVFLVVSGR